MAVRPPPDAAPVFKPVPPPPKVFVIDKNTPPPPTTTYNVCPGVTASVPDTNPPDPPVL